MNLFQFNKTPHVNPLNHARNLLGYFIASALLVVFAGVGVELSGSPLAGGLAALLCAGVAMAGGLLATMAFRATFGLVQTGRIAQYAGFWLAALLGLHLADFAFGSVSVSNPLLASITLFSVAFGTATAFGEIPWRGRSWLPVRRKA